MEIHVEEKAKNKGKQRDETKKGEIPMREGNRKDRRSEKFRR